MSTRSMMPRMSCSEPIGISVATTCGPKAAFRDSRVRKKSARSRSSMFTYTSRATPSSWARCHRRWVPTSTPMTALTTNTADSDTRSAPRASAMKDGSPGVSIRFTLTSRQLNEASDAEIDIPRDFSSSSESETVVPSATEPRRVVAPASNSRASCSDVFPLPRWPTNATLRILSAGWDMPGTSSLLCLPLPRGGDGAGEVTPDRPMIRGWLGVVGRAGDGWPLSHVVGHLGMRPIGSGERPRGETPRGSVDLGLPEVVALEAGLEAQDGLRVQLGDPGLGDA